MCEICSKMAIKIPEYVIDVVLVSLLLTDLTYCSRISIVEFEQVNTYMELKKQMIFKGPPTELQHALKFNSLTHSATVPQINGSQESL